jgi:hypothetical protein
VCVASSQWLRRGEVRRASRVYGRVRSAIGGYAVGSRVAMGGACLLYNRGRERFIVVQLRTSEVRVPSRRSARRNKR